MYISLVLEFAKNLVFFLLLLSIHLSILQCSTVALFALLFYYLSLYYRCLTCKIVTFYYLKNTKNKKNIFYTFFLLQLCLYIVIYFKLFALYHIFYYTHIYFCSTKIHKKMHYLYNTLFSFFNFINFRLFELFTETIGLVLFRARHTFLAVPDFAPLVFCYITLDYLLWYMYKNTISCLLAKVVCMYD